MFSVEWKQCSVKSAVYSMNCGGQCPLALWEQFGAGCQRCTLCIAKGRAQGRAQDRAQGKAASAVLGGCIRKPEAHALRCFPPKEYWAWGLEFRDLEHQILHSGSVHTYLICVIFSSTEVIFGSTFSTQKCVNCDTPDFASKVRKLGQNQFYNKTA